MMVKPKMKGMAQNMRVSLRPILSTTQPPSRPPRPAPIVTTDCKRHIIYDTAREMEVLNGAEPKNTSSREAAVHKLFGSSRIFQTSELKQYRPDLCANLILKDKATNHHEAGLLAASQSRFAHAITCFSKAITLQPEQTQLYVDRAESYLQLCDFNSAALDYKHACYLEPQTRANFDRLAFIYYLQATMCYFDLKAALRLDPSCSQARALLEELEQAAEHSRQQAITKALEGELSDALAKMTTALEQNPEKAHYYIFRGTLYRRLNDFPAAIEDLALAVELGGEPERSVALEEDGRTQLALAYNDFAVHCFSRGFYSEAIMLLTRAICERRDESGLFINRGDCFYKQKEWHFALADYQQADELDPHSTTIRLRLATIHNTLGLNSYNDLKFQEAVERFSAAIEYEPGVAQYYRNRAKAHRRMHGVEEAKQDAISALILDPSSDEASPWPSVCERSAYSGTLELVPLVLSLFPGCSLSDVTSSTTAQTVRVGLMAQIQACKTTASPASRLSEKLEKMVLECDADGQFDTDCQSMLSGEEVEAGLEPHVFPQQLARSKEQGHPCPLKVPLSALSVQVVQAVRTLLQQRQPLCHMGPRLAPLRAAVHTPERTSSAARRSYAWRDFGGIGLSC
ncbi:hypothetical protein P4O66_012269 [Electrophorus voltai]|uniref:Tetratricopeptide repeat protein 16 n=1 Tax=Electrophorus voltai TaxID=2609070 RepID=A0AAD8Z6K5_9TELE|nr:hypothetical protein P4O66_012269 [Electrophorus voltai]